MDQNNSNTVAIQRLTALWALNESGLGGLLHAFNSAFTGLIVGSIAIILISLICRLSENKYKTVLTALSIVLIVKAAVAPHSNVTAYFAVSFQAVAGILIFSIFRSDYIASTLLGVSALVESSLQKLIAWTLIYGKTFWQAIDDLGAWLSLKIGYLLPFAASKILIISYVAIHVIMGLIVGYFCAKLIKSIKANLENDDYKISISADDFKEFMSNRKPVIKSKFFLITIFMTILGLVLYGYFTEGWQTGLYILARTAIVLFVLYAILGPLILKAINAILKKKESRLADEIKEVFDLLPYLRFLVSKAWKESLSESRLRRYYSFITLILLYTLKFKKAQ